MRCLAASYTLATVSSRVADRARLALAALLVRCCTYVALCCTCLIVQSISAQELRHAGEGTKQPQPSQRERCIHAHAEAQQLRMYGSLLAAREELLVCGRNECPAPVMNDCAGWLNEVEASLSSLVFAVSDREGHDIVDATVRTDGKVLSERTDGRALTLDPGTYTFTFTAPQHASVAVTLSVRQSEKNRIVRVVLPLPLPAAEDAGGQRALSATRPTPAATGAHPVPLVSYILAGTTLVGVGGFAYFGLSGNAEYRQLQRCADDCADVRRAGRRDYILADIALGIAVVSLPAAIITYFVARPDRDAAQPNQNARHDAAPGGQRRDVQIAPLWLRDGGGMQVRASF